jgi:hypothetical protein
MGFEDWARDSTRRIREEGWSGVTESVYELYLGMFRQLGRRWNYGVPIYETEWDLLIVLDACRADLIAEVTDEYEFVDEKTTYSVASSSGEWMQKNFRDTYREEMQKTAYVTGNAFSDQHLSEREFLLLNEVWRYAFDHDIRTIPAEAITDRGIHVGRNHDPDRMILHYMQPHYPFVPDPLDRGLSIFEDGSPWRNVWEKLRAGELDRDRVWRAYLENLRYVLDSVGILLSNVDADRVVITADHGNLLGELGLYDHPQYVPLRPLKAVPWCVTTAEDNETREPTVEPEGPQEISTEEQLKALGYR